MNEKIISNEIKVVKDSCGCGCACYGAEESKDEELSKLEELENSNERYNDSSKLYIDIYVPLDACACEWSQFMNLMFSAITPYIKHIKHETKSLNTDEARRMNLFNKCVIVDGKKKYATSAALKRDLPRLLEEKGLM